MESLEAKKYRLECDCACHEVGITVNWDLHSGKVFSDCCLSFWQIGNHTNKWAWAMRFRMIWEILTTGHCYADMVTFDVHERKKFYEIMKEVIEIDERLKPVN
jgi:hypothetical protein